MYRIRAPTKANGCTKYEEDLWNIVGYRAVMNQNLKHQLVCIRKIHYTDVIMGSIASQITSLTIVYSAVYSGADQRKHQSSASLAFVRGIHRGPVDSPHKGPVTRKMFPFDDVIMFKVPQSPNKITIDIPYEVEFVLILMPISVQTTNRIQYKLWAEDW